MKTLFLIRHAKSSWKHDITDIDRPLSTRGYSDANLLSNEFLKYNFIPDALFSSPANRALTTCNIFMQNCNYPASLLTIVENLYDFGGHQVAGFMRDLDDRYNNVMLFGHNNAFTTIVNNFGDIAIENVPTCGLVMLQFDIHSWQNIDKGHTKMTLFPKELKP
ncbi:MAG TPA: phosphoglycerate mutase family protein [Aquaticitalea sp.]|nr:phosphoglycerate mutase family protein [Aquaticitalea sp.]